ncbi:MAG TPA: tetratricopeptide repeat protein [Terriglobia bacterium]|jgi:tetratricopeptide (TPR) repeat protein|nr:tetratricopeptide repeat protein [Terriglobia bacterium]
MVRFFARRKEEQIPLPRLRDRNDSLGHFHLHWWTEGAPNTQGDMSFRAKRSGARNLLLIEALGHAVVLGLVCACCLRLARPGFAAQHLDAGHSSAVHADEAFQRINVLVSSHQFDAAERLFQQELSAENAASAYLRLGGIYFDHKEWLRAAAAFQKSLESNSHNDRAHLLLGLTWRELKKPEDAEAELQKAVQENPSSETNTYLAGHQLLLDEKYEAALEYLYKAVELNPADSAALRALGMAQARLGSYGLAESYYRKAAEAAGATPDAAGAYTDLAFLLLLGNDPGKADEALRCAREAVKLNPSSPDAHYLAGKALFKLGRLPQAVEELHDAEKLNPDDSKPHFLLAQAYDRLGETQKAATERKTLAQTKARAATSGAAAGSSLPPDSR